MLLFVMLIPLLFCAVVPVLPVKVISLTGRFAPAGPILQFEMVLLSLPVVIAAEPNHMLPPLVPKAMVAEPRMDALVMVLFVASAWKRIVLVPEVDEVLVLEMV